ncbi:MAG: hypothetical protein JSV27_08995 [Candidatus Bathyarchaeota archaeon]|nr:MAG: hypothetical protein JSV27_08995 [Candidatus Bathyarchaeota archaeon]
MEIPYTNYPSEEIAITEEYFEQLPQSILRDLKIRKQNMEDLKALQRIILVEEDRQCSVDEILARVLSLYRKFVPYR